MPDAQGGGDVSEALAKVGEGFAVTGYGLRVEVVVQKGMDIARYGRV